MKSTICSTFIMVAFLGLAACKQGIPEISDLKSLSGFFLDQQHLSVANKLAPSINVSGTCVSAFSEIQVSLDGAKSWEPVSNYALAQNFRCHTSGTFSYSLSFGPSLFASSNQAKIYFKAIAELGSSDARPLNLAVFSKYFNSLTMGGHQVPASGVGLKLTGQIVSVANSQLASGGSLKLKGRLVAR